MRAYTRFRGGAIVLAVAFVAVACGSSGPTTAERPDDASLEPEVVATPTVGPTPSPTPATTDYTIVAGDTLGAIAANFGVTVDELLEANGMTLDTVLNIGEVIRVPIPPPETDTGADGELAEGDRILTDYTVAAGDTLGTIAARFDTTADELADMNEIAIDTVLDIGDVLLVPVPSASAPETAPEGPVPAPGTNRIDIDEYVVVSGDTLGAIAARFGITLAELMEVNNLGSDSVLQVGQVLTIPEP